MFGHFNNRFAFQCEGEEGFNEWEGWTPPWLRHGHHHHGHRGPGARFFQARMRHGLFGPGGPFGPDPEQHGHGHGPHFGEGRRFFGRGDVKYALLELLQERPMHGYEMMKALEERSGGFYTPSAGTIYPTLQMLEDRGLVNFQEVDGKKVYNITEAGKAFLAERKQEEESFVPPWARKFGQGGPGARWKSPEVQALRTEAMEVARLFAIAGRKSFQDPQQLAQLRTLLEHTRKELSDLIYGTPQTDQPKDSTDPQQ
jgi:DNA-binding PadR family transcriptional regulator